MLDWQKTTNWEKNWWGNCVNTYGEEEKQLVYAKRMGLTFFHNRKSPYNIDLKGKSVLDIGGGPVSLLLKCIVDKSCTVVDPCDYPEWVSERYKAAKIVYFKEKGENISPHVFYDEVWIYNVLQHTEDPEKIIKNARKVSKIIRIFEWIDTPTNEGHPHTLTEKKLNEWLGGEGKTEMFNDYTLKGRGYYGIFLGDKHE